MEKESGYGAAVFWGIVAVATAAVGVLVALLAGYLLGHFTHVRTRTVALRTVTRTVPSTEKDAAGPALTTLAPVSLAPAAPKTVAIGAGIQGPRGLTATLWAHGPATVADMAEGPNGSVFVSTAGETGKPVDAVYYLRKGRPPVKVVGGLVGAQGVAWHDSQLFVSSFGRVDSYGGFSGSSFSTHHSLLEGLPGGKLGWNDDLRLGPDGRFYMGIGSPCDHCAPVKPLSATIVSFRPDGTDLQIFASGVRGNSSIAFAPGTDNLFMVTNQRNDVSGKPVPDEFGLVQPGSFWGYPWCWQQGGVECRGVSRPLAYDDPHGASFGLAFIDGKWGSAYGLSAFASEWLTGRVLRIAVTQNGNSISARPEVLLSGMRNPGPLLALPDGDLLVSSYATGMIELHHEAGAPPPAAAAPAVPTPTSPNTPVTSSATPSGAIPISANPAGALSFSSKTLTAKAGSDTFAFTNNAPVEHNFAIVQDGKVIGTTPTFSGGTKLLTVHLKPGSYTFECTVPGHAMAGMKGVLTVN